MKKEYVLKDSGFRRTSDSGAQRDRLVGKGRYDLMSPLALKRVADIFEKGAMKYADRNWEKGMPLSWYIDSALRHILQYLEGKRDEDHTGQAAWNLMCLMHTEEMIERGLLPKGLNDLPNYLADCKSEDKEFDEAMDFLKSKGMLESDPKAPNKKK